MTAEGSGGDGGGIEFRGIRKEIWHWQRSSEKVVEFQETVMLVTRMLSAT